MESAQKRGYFAPQGWLPTPELRVASDRPTGGAHGWLKSAAGRATGSELRTRKSLIRLDFIEHKSERSGMPQDTGVGRNVVLDGLDFASSGWRLPAPMLEQTVVHLIRQHVDATTFSASLIHTPTMQELASVRRFLDGLCSGSNDDSASAAPLLRLIRRVDISPGSVSILLDRNAFAACLSMGPDRIREDALRILAPFRLRRRGVTNT